jgi:hypothetical protein
MQSDLHQIAVLGESLAATKTKLRGVAGAANRDAHGCTALR